MPNACEYFVRKVICNAERDSLRLASVAVDTQRPI
jgi:hypothetical protein